MSEPTARSDADGTNIDKILEHLGSIRKDSEEMKKRLDAMEEEKKADKRADAKRRRDAEREPWMKADAEGCARDDAAEEEAAKKYADAGDDEETAMDKARKDRRDAMKARMDAAVSEEEKKKKEKEEADRKDAEARAEADRKDAQIRADTIAADQRKLAERIANMPLSPNDAEYTIMADAQASYDPVYQAFGNRAPAPMQSETNIAYRRRLARNLQKHSAAWKGVELAALPAEALTIAEGHIRADAMAASKTAFDTDSDELFPVQRMLESGHRVTEFRGRNTIFKRMSSPAKCATEFLTGNRA